MSYIRCSTPMGQPSDKDRTFTRRGKGKLVYEKTSDTYAWGDCDGYVYITNGWKRQKSYGGNVEGLVRLTPAEMRFMVRQYARQMRRDGFKV